MAAGPKLLTNYVLISLPPKDVSVSVYILLYLKFGPIIPLLFLSKGKGIAFKIGVANWSLGDLEILS